MKYQDLYFKEFVNNVGRHFSTRYLEMIRNLYCLPLFMVNL